ncbi:MAG: DUF2889 domain-containing protein [Acidimicrobiales bacterium]
MSAPPVPASPDQSVPAAGVPTHRREMTFEVFEEGEDFHVTGRLRDERPWAAGTVWVEHVHDMELRITVHRPDLTITSATAHMHRFPHAECTDIEEAFAGLVGLNVARGYSRAVQERFGRSLGCTHLELLARTIGPVVIQSVASAATRLQDATRTRVAMTSAGSAWFADTCHVWATDGPTGPGPGMQKVSLGWRPGTDEYPAPSVDEVRRRASAAGGPAGPQ